ncbi:hypothetical protein [Microbulbifer hainanensis]|uniref:hypothetical protein n=1 Tax=Microbulbifer hainanensis TaxID=2735675 RepID=UPI0018688320|nr:hypothetical protein [Microbulbifer hainanensis]
MVEPDSIYSYLFTLMAIAAVLALARIIFSLLSVGKTVKMAKGEHNSRGLLFYLSIVMISSIAGLGSFLGYKQYLKLNHEYEAQARINAKKAFIRPKEWCLTQASRIYNSSGYIKKTLYVPKYYDACLNISKTNMDFCASLEPMLIYSSSGKYFSSACKNSQIGQPGCEALYKVASKYCAG